MSCFLTKLHPGFMAFTTELMKYDIKMFQKLDQILQYKGTLVGIPMGYLSHLGTHI